MWRKLNIMLAPLYKASIQLACPLSMDGEELYKD